MIVSVPKEVVPGERRVALTPDVVRRLVGGGLSVRVEQGAGIRASFPDETYKEAGAEIVSGADKLWQEPDIVVKVQPPTAGADGGPNETAMLGSGKVLVGMLQPYSNWDVISQLATNGVTAFGLEVLPRITRAQPMDVLSSMSTVAGYKAVLLAAASLGQFFPMLVTAAGTIVPAKVFVLGAGVAGLQAIATARRLGAVVKAFDVRPAVKEQVESLGAAFVAAEAVTGEGEGSGGYAKELSEDQHEKELELIAENVVDVDVVITTALIPGKPAPLLITGEMVASMKPGSVIVDLAAEAGGNCEATRPGEDVESHNVLIKGPLNLPSSMPADASRMYAKNISAFLAHIAKDGEIQLDFDDEITRGTCVTHDGNVMHEGIKQAIDERG
ncbi:MAG: Re/Si-specific NAD(P)(+) transhydrogenase subunit alpha [Gemmatimonadales bacterium]